MLIGNLYIHTCTYCWNLTKFIPSVLFDAKEHQLNMTEYKQKYCLIIYILQMKLSMGVRRSISKSSNNWINICKAIFIYLFYLLNYFNTHSSHMITYSCRYIMMKVLCNVFIFENYRQFKHTHGKMCVTPLQKKN